MNVSYLLFSGAWRNVLLTLPRMTGGCAQIPSIIPFVMHRSIPYGRLSCHDMAFTRSNIFIATIDTDDVEVMTNTWTLCASCGSHEAWIRYSDSYAEARAGSDACHRVILSPFILVKHPTCVSTRCGRDDSGSVTVGVTWNGWKLSSTDMTRYP